MLVFADNDILIKLAGCSLLDRFLIALDQPEIRIAPATRFSLPNQARKKIRDQGRVVTLCTWLDNVESVDKVQDLTLLDRLSEIPGIDGGEGVLFASLCEAQHPTRLITGDRRALRALLAHEQQLQDVFDRLKGSVYTLESALLLLVEQFGFAEIDESMRARAIEDKVIDMAFGPNRNSEHARLCLSSSTREVLPLLANADLVLPAQ